MSSNNEGIIQMPENDQNTTAKEQCVKTHQRASNIELLRIIAMLMIVIYGILGVILHYAFIKPKLLPAIYNYLSTKREDQHK